MRIALQNLLIPLGLTVLVYFLSSDGPDLTARLMLTLAIGVVAMPCLEATAVGWTRTTSLAAQLTDRNRWLFVWQVTAFVVALNEIITWSGPEIALTSLQRGALVGLVMGILNAFVFNKSERAVGNFDILQPGGASLLGRLVVYGWPFAATAIVVGSALAPPDGGWNGIYPLFQMAFLPFLVMLYPLRGTILGNWPLHAPRLAGYVLMIAALIIA